ncbi:MAG: dihydroneopterin aldolase [Paramuribaculum sp.]|nr:dihydroneopterin aldolase [Paramuribaculum sp.]
MNSTAIGYTVEVNAMRMRAYHGVMEQERTVGNTFEVTVHLMLPAEVDFAVDDLALTVNYAQVCDVIREVMAVPSALLEHVCHRMRRKLLEAFPQVSGGMIRLAKLAPPISGLQVDSVAVTLTF